jgi:hypothetical protein
MSFSVANVVVVKKPTLETVHRMVWHLKYLGYTIHSIVLMDVDGVFRNTYHKYQHIRKIQKRLAKIGSAVYFVPLDTVSRKLYQHKKTADTLPPSLDGSIEFVHRYLAMNAISEDGYDIAFYFEQLMHQMLQCNPLAIVMAILDVRPLCMETLLKYFAQYRTNGYSLILTSRFEGPLRFRSDMTHIFQIDLSGYYETFYLFRFTDTNGYWDFQECRQYGNTEKPPLKQLQL